MSQASRDFFSQHSDLTRRRSNAGWYMPRNVGTAYSNECYRVQEGFEHLRRARVASQSKQMLDIGTFRMLYVTTYFVPDDGSGAHAIPHPPQNALLREPFASGILEFCQRRAGQLPGGSDGCRRTLTSHSDKSSPWKARSDDSPAQARWMFAFGHPKLPFKWESVKRWSLAANSEWFHSPPEDDGPVTSPRFFESPMSRMTTTLRAYNTTIRVHRILKDIPHKPGTITHTAEIKRQGECGEPLLESSACLSGAHLTLRRSSHGRRLPEPSVFSRTVNWVYNRSHNSAIDVTDPSMLTSKMSRLT